MVFQRADCALRGGCDLLWLVGEGSGVEFASIPKAARAWASLIVPRSRRVWRIWMATSARTRVRGLCAGTPLTRTVPSSISRAGSSRPGKRRWSRVSRATRGARLAAGMAGFSLGSGWQNRDRAVKEDHGRGHAGSRRARARQNGRCRWQRPGSPRGSSANAIAFSSCYRSAAPACTQRHRRLAHRLARAVCVRKCSDTPEGLLHFPGQFPHHDPDDLQSGTCQDVRQSGR